MFALVTGGGGFIGSHVVEQLCLAGHRVRALVRVPPKAAFVRSLGAELARGDVTDPSTLNDALSGIDVVFHLASRVTDWGSWPQFESVIVGGTRNVLDASTKAGVKRFIHFSSVAVYENRHSARHPIITEDAPHSGRGDRSHGHYARAKVLAEEAAFAAQAAGKLPVTALRPALVYGPRDSVTMPRLVDYLKSPLALWIGRANPTVDPIFAADVARCALRAAQSEAAIGQAYNVAPDVQIGTRDFQRELCAQLGIAPPRWTVPKSAVSALTFVVENSAKLLRTKEPPTMTKAGLAIFTENRHHTPAKALADFGWRAEVSLTDGLRQTAQWLRESAGGM